MKFARSVFIFFAYLNSRLVGLFNIIAPPSLPVLYRFSLAVFFGYLVIGIINLSYKNITLLKISAMTEQTEQINLHKNKLAHEMELLSNPVLLEYYYREAFGLTTPGEVGVSFTD